MPDTFSSPVQVTTTISRKEIVSVVCEVLLAIFYVAYGVYLFQQARKGVSSST